MFWRLIRSALTRRRGGRVLLAATTALGASVSTAMLAVMFDVGDKVNQELSTYGANIVVQPQNAAILGQFYDLDTGVSAGPGLAENQVANVKTIFWAFNIVAFSPFLETETILNVTSGSAPHPTPTANTTSDTTTQTTPDTTAHTAETHNQHSHSDPAPASTTQTTSDTTTHQTTETH
ncbi:MAG: hypothetical protein LBC29_03340, partial [Propionibacteriaceae bacterium]|nr:hypothetical protein [Propionibacteriaceae bacterium]